MIAKLKKIKHLFENLYLYDAEKGIKESLKFFIADKNECFNYFHINKTGGKYIKNFLISNLDRNQFKEWSHIVKLKWLNPKNKYSLEFNN